MDNSKEREAERLKNKEVLRDFDSEAPQRADGSIRGEELADKLAAKNASTSRLAEMAREDAANNRKPKDVHTELLISQDGELNF
ncbi:hypothetical protein [Arthrobacter sp. 135MFCol5.1]|uniref:hypothetical protein n=1 Tax=Arthrobacter sp. 135MFCol5.1 TaxID=1158050 RepID=UPI00037AA9E9|nr:hypothetical protein [Arthrobacter sp. 135MFCol5.1]